MSEENKIMKMTPYQLAKVEGLESKEAIDNFISGYNDDIEDAEIREALITGYHCGGGQWVQRYKLAYISELFSEFTDLTLLERLVLLGIFQYSSYIGDDKKYENDYALSKCWLMSVLGKELDNEVQEFAIASKEEIAQAVTNLRKKGVLLVVDQCFNDTLYYLRDIVYNKPENLEKEND